MNAFAKWRAAWFFGAFAAIFVVSLTSKAVAQSGTLIVQMPFRGTATEDVLHEAEDGVRNGLLARGATGPDRTTVQNALGVSPAADTTAIIAFGRSMGGTHVLIGQVTPLTGQYNLELRLYEISSGRVATQQRNIGDGEEGTVIPDMLTGLFAPGAMQLSPEEQARLAEAQRQRAEEQRRQADEQRRQEAARRAEVERQRQLAEQRRLAARHLYRYAEGGPGSLGAGLLLGGRFTGTQVRPAGAPPAQSLVAGLRIEGGYAVLPSIGLEIGGSALVVLAPTDAFAIGASARFAYPWSGYFPIRASLGATAGLFVGLSGARSTTAWISVDARAEYDLFSAVTIFAGVVVDVVPSLFSSIGGIAGLRFRFGGGSTAPAANASSPSPNASSTAPADQFVPAQPADG